MAEAIGAVIIDVKSDISYLVRGMKKAEGVVDSAVKNMTRAGIALGAVFGAISLTSLMNDFKSMETRTLELSKTTGLLEKDLEAVTNEFNEMSIAMGGFEVKGLYEIGAIAGQLGIKGVDNIKTFTKEVQYMVSSSKLQAEEAATGFAKLANSMSLPITDINHLTGAFTALASSTTATEGDLLSYSQRLAGAGKTFELTNAQIAGIGATLSDVGVEFEVGGTAMSGLFMKMMMDTEKFAIASKVSLIDYSKMIKDKPIKAVEAFLKSLGGFDKITKIKVLDKLGIGDSEAINTLLKLSTATDKLSKNIDISTKAYSDGDATLKEYNATKDSLANQETKMTSAILLQKEALGKELKPIMLEVIETTVDTTKFLKENSETIEGVAYAIGGVALAYGVLTTAQKANIAWSTGAGAIGMVSQLARMNQLQRSLALAVVSQKALNVAMKATPWGLAIAGVGALAAGMHNLWETEKADALAVTEYRTDEAYFDRQAKKSLDAYNNALKVKTQNIRAIAALEKVIALGYGTDIGKKNMESTLKSLRAKQNLLDGNLISAKADAEFDDNIIESKIEINKKSEEIVATAEKGKNVLKDFVNLQNRLKNVKTQTLKIDKEAKKISERNEKRLREVKRLEDERLQDLLAFNNTYNQSTMSEFNYKLQLLDKEKSGYIAIGAEKLKVDKWYYAEYIKLIESKNKKAQQLRKEEKRIVDKQWDDTELHQMEQFEAHEDNLKKKLEGEIAYQDLLGNYDYGNQLEYEEKSLWYKDRAIELSSEQIKMIEKQTHAQNDLNNAFEQGLNTILNGILAGDNLGETLQNAIDGFNSSSIDSFSESITNSISEGFKNGKAFDFGLTDKNGSLTATGQNGLMVAGNLFAKTAFGNSKNAKRGTEYGQMAGMAIGTYMGSPALGSAIGTMMGGAIGTMMGGEKSYYTAVDTDGKIEAHQRISGGLFHSSKDNILLGQTAQLQAVFTETVETYEFLLTNLFDINKDIKILAGKYSGDTLMASVVPQAVIDAWTQPPVSQMEIDYLNSLLYQRAGLYEDLAYGGDGTAEIDRLGEEIDSLTKEFNITLTNGLKSLATGIQDIALDELSQLGQDKSNKIKEAWSAYAENKDKTFNEAFIEAMQGLDSASLNVFEFLNKDDEITILENRIERTKEARYTLQRQIQELEAEERGKERWELGGTLFGRITLKNYDNAKKEAIDDGATPHQIEQWTRLGAILIADATNADALTKAIFDENEAKKQSQLSLKNSIAMSVKTFENWAESFNKTDLEKAMHTKIASEKDYENALNAVGLTSTSTADILNYLNTSNEKSLVLYNNLAEAYQLNSESQTNYNNALLDSNGIITDLTGLMDSFSNISLDFSDFNTTINMSESEKLDYRIREITKDMRLIGVNFENFADILNDVKVDIEKGKVTKSDLENWSSLNSLIQKQHTLRIALMQEERDAILQTGESISSSIKTLVFSKISEIQKDYNTKAMAITSLNSNMEEYAPAKTLYSADIYSSIANSSILQNSTIESNIKSFHSQQLNQISRIEKKRRASYDNEAKRLADIEKIRVENHNASIDSSNEMIRANNSLADIISNLKRDVSGNFKTLYADTQQKIETSFLENLDNRNYDDISSSFSSFATATKESGISDIDAFIKIAYANKAVQDIATPIKQTELQKIEATTIKISDFVSTLAEDEKQVNDNTLAMYQALINQNKINLPNVEAEIKQISNQNKHYFDTGSDFYTFLERGATELTYTQKMEEQKNLFIEHKAEVIAFNVKNLGELGKINTNLSRYTKEVDTKITNNKSSIQNLNIKISELLQQQIRANKIQEDVLAEQLKSNALATKMVKNTDQQDIVEVI